MATLVEQLLLSFVGSILTAIGFIVKRKIENRSAIDLIEKNQKLLELHSKLNEKGVTLDALGNLEAVMLGRKAESASRLSDEYQQRVIQLMVENSHESMTQGEMNEQAFQAFNRANRRLSSLISEFEQYLDSSRKIELQAVQNAWDSFRTKHAEFCADQYRGGSIAPLIYASAAEDVTITRIMEIDSQLREMKRLQ
jgi:uncharacterized protein YecT (DUF1311 family)